MAPRITIDQRQVAEFCKRHRVRSAADRSRSRRPARPGPDAPRRDHREAAKNVSPATEARLPGIPARGRSRDHSHCRTAPPLPTPPAAL